MKADEKINPDGLFVRELNRLEKGQSFLVEAGDLSQNEVDRIADQLPNEVFDHLDGRDLTGFDRSVYFFNVESNDYEPSKRFLNERNRINIAHQIGLGLEGASLEFPHAKALVFAEIKGSNGQAFRKNQVNRIGIYPSGLRPGIAQGIATSIHERGHLGLYGDTDAEHSRLHPRVNEIMDSFGFSDGSFGRGCQFIEC